MLSLDHIVLSLPIEIEPSPLELLAVPIVIDVLPIEVLFSPIAKQ